MEFRDYRAYLELHAGDTVTLASCATANDCRSTSPSRRKGPRRHPRDLPPPHPGVHLLAGHSRRFPQGRGCHRILLGAVEDDRAAQDQDVRGTRRVPLHRQHLPSTWDWQDFWLKTAFLSIILAVMNIIPIPGLDGGHAIFTFWEMITRRKVSDKVLEAAQYVGLVIILMLLLYANGNDIYRFFIK